MASSSRCRKLSDVAQGGASQPQVSLSASWPMGIVQMWSCTLMTFIANANSPASNATHGESAQQARHRSASAAAPRRAKKSLKTVYIACIVWCDL